MRGEAKYEIQVPVQDNLGNQLRDLATAGHQYLHHEAGIDGSQIHGPIRGNWRDDPQEPFNLLTVYADDTPEHDSHVKALAKNIGMAANQWAVFATKSAGDKHQTWPINNPHYVPGAPAQPWAILGS